MRVEIPRLQVGGVPPQLWEAAGGQISRLIFNLSMNVSSLQVAKSCLCKMMKAASYSRRLDPVLIRGSNCDGSFVDDFGTGSATNAEIETLRDMNITRT